MGADHIVHLDCSPKRKLGGGDIKAGSESIREGLKAQHRAAMLADQAREKNKSLDSLKIRVRRIGPGGKITQQKIGHADLMAEAGALVLHQSHCTRCPANARRTPYGCYGYLEYPISRDAEVWLMEQLQPGTSLGGALLLEAITEYGLDGRKIQDRRRLGVFDEQQPIDTVIAGHGRKERVSSNQIFEALLGRSPLPAEHCGLMLLWFGALRIGGKLPADARDLTPLDRMRAATTPHARQAAAELEVPPSDGNPDAGGLQGLMAGMYHSWVLDVPLVTWP